MWPPPTDATAAESNNGLVKTGSGSTTLNGSDTSTGGTLVLDDGGVVGDGGAVVVVNPGGSGTVSVTPVGGSISGGTLSLGNVNSAGDSQLATVGNLVVPFNEGFQVTNGVIVSDPASPSITLQLAGHGAIQLDPTSSLVGNGGTGIGTGLLNAGQIGNLNSSVFNGLITISIDGIHPAIVWVGNSPFIDLGAFLGNPPMTIIGADALGGQVTPGLVIDSGSSAPPGTP